MFGIREQSQLSSKTYYANGLTFLIYQKTQMSGCVLSKTVRCPLQVWTAPSEHVQYEELQARPTSSWSSITGENRLKCVVRLQVFPLDMSTWLPSVFSSYCVVTLLRVNTVCCTLPFQYFWMAGDRGKFINALCTASLQCLLCLSVFLVLCMFCCSPSSVRCIYHAVGLVCFPHPAYILNGCIG